MDYQELAAEIANDPEDVGYAQHASSGADTLVAALLNARTGAGAGDVTEPVLAKGDFVLAITPALARIDALENASLRTVWGRYWEAIQCAETFRVADPRLAGLLDLAVTHGVLTAEERAAVGVRTGSRAEVLWGAGTVVSADDVARALRGA